MVFDRVDGTGQIAKLDYIIEKHDFQKQNFWKTYTYTFIQQNIDKGAIHKLC